MTKTQVVTWLAKVIGKALAEKFFPKRFTR